MRLREQGFLLLTCDFGDPGRKPLTPADFRKLSQRVRAMPRTGEDRNIELADLLQMGYNREEGAHILRLFSQRELMFTYLREAEACGCYPIVRNSEAYPDRLRQILGEAAPVVLWGKGDAAILNTPMVSLVGSRDLLPDNRLFAERIGQLAAQQGFTLVSGNARGADRAAQDACRACGGRVISVVADSLREQREENGILYLSENGFRSGFTSARALSRNHVIHAFGSKVFVAQCGLGRGGTWSGTAANLKNKRTPVVCFDDGSEAVAELIGMGATTADLNIKTL